MARYIILLLVLFMIGCSGEPHHFPSKLYIDPQFSNEQAEVIVNALSEWSRATNGIVDESPVIGWPEDPNYRHKVIYANSWDERVRYAQKTRNEDINGFAESDNGVITFGLPSPGEIYLVMDTIDNKLEEYPELLNHVILHELGHHFGLHHDPEESSLMYWKNTKTCIGTRDLERFCSIGYDCSGYRIKSSCSGD